MSRQALASLDRLLLKAKEGELPLPVLLQGEEDYRVEEARRRLLAAIFPDEEERRAAVETVSARELSLPLILERAAAAPLFASRTALVVRDAEVLGRGGVTGASGGTKRARPARKSGGADSAASSPWDKVPGDAIIILVAHPGIDRRTRFFKDIETRGAVLEFPRLAKEGEVADWAVRYLRYWKKSITRDACSLLVEYTLSHDGVSLRALAQELDKLVLYVGEAKAIERGDVEALVGKSREEMIFALTNALAERSGKKALARLSEFLERGEYPLALLSLLARELRFLLHARILYEAVPSAREGTERPFAYFRTHILPQLNRRSLELGWGEKHEFFSRNPYAVYLKVNQAGRFTLEELMRGVGLAARADRELKSSGRPPRLVLEDLVLRLAEPNGFGERAGREGHR